MKMFITSSTREILKIKRPSRMSAIASSLAAMAALAVVSCGPTVPCECPATTGPCGERNAAVSVPKPADGLPIADMRPINVNWDPSSPKFNSWRAARFAKYSYPYAIASVKAYRFDKKEAFLHFPTGECWAARDARECHYTEDPIGFAAKTWLRTKCGGSQELVIAFRGTQFEECTDWKYANFVPLSQARGDNQYKAALVYAKKVVASAEVDRPGIRVILTGHSLGGGLAEYCQRFIQNSEAVTFDPSPNQGVLYAWGRRETRKDVVRVYERGEILSYTRFIGSPDLKCESEPQGEGVRAIWVDFYDSNPISAHSIHDLAMCLVKAADLNGDAGAKSVHEKMKKDRDDGKLQSPEDQRKSRKRSSAARHH